MAQGVVERVREARQRDIHSRRWAPHARVLNGRKARRQQTFMKEWKKNRTRTHSLGVQSNVCGRSAAFFLHFQYSLAFADPHVGVGKRTRAKPFYNIECQMLIDFVWMVDGECGYGYEWALCENPKHPIVMALSGIDVGAFWRGATKVEMTISMPHNINIFLSDIIWATEISWWARARWEGLPGCSISHNWIQTQSQKHLKLFQNTGFVWWNCW